MAVTGMSNLAMKVADLDPAVTELDAHGIEYVRGVQGASVVQIRVTDPAGYTVERQQDDTRR